MATFDYRLCTQYESRAHMDRPAYFSQWEGDPIEIVIRKDATDEQLTKLSARFDVSVDEMKAFRETRALPRNVVTRPHVLPPLKHGETVPDGYILVPICPEPINCDGAPYTPVMHRFFFGDKKGQRVVRLAQLKEGKYGAAAIFLLANGKKCTMAFTKKEHLFDEALTSLSLVDQAALQAHVLPTLQPN